MNAVYTFDSRFNFRFDMIETSRALWKKKRKLYCWFWYGGWCNMLFSDVCMKIVGIGL